MLAMGNVIFDYSRAAGFVSAEEMENMKATAMCAKNVLMDKSGAGSDFLGWIDLPVDYDKEEFQRIKRRFKMIRMFCWSSVSAVPILEPGQP